MKTEAIIFDIDGTAIDSPVLQAPSSRLSRALSNAEDTYYLCAATGRAWSFAKPLLNALGLIDPCVISGGTQICNPKTGEIIWQCDIERADIDSLLQILRNHDTHMLLINDYDEEDYLLGGVPPSKAVIRGPINLIEQTFVPESEALEIIEKVSLIDGITCTIALAQKPGQIDLHFTNRSATKEHAVGELLKMLNVDKDKSTGIGDGHNDVHLFNAVGHKVAMGNAVDELKAAADEVIGSVKQDGLAAYIELVLSKANA